VARWPPLGLISDSETGGLKSHDREFEVLARESRSARPTGKKRAKRVEGPPTGPEVEEARPQLSLQIALALDEMARAVEGPDEAEADSGGTA